MLYAIFVNFFRFIWVIQENKSILFLHLVHIRKQRVASCKKWSGQAASSGRMGVGIPNMGEYMGRGNFNL